MQQLAFFTPPPVEDFTSDDYETPDHIARAMADLVLPTDMAILEPFAGSGQIAKFLPSDRLIDVVEIKRSRYSRLRNYCFSYNGSFFEFKHHDDYDLIISNPPFSLCVEAIEHALTLLNRDNPTARILFLMPLDWNCAQSRARQWESLDAHIHHVYRIAERVDYLMNGVPCSKTQKVKDGVPQFKKSGKPEMMSGRQCYDAVFDIRPGRDGAVSSFLNAKRG